MTAAEAKSPAGKKSTDAAKTIWIMTSSTRGWRSFKLPSVALWLCCLRLGQRKRGGGFLAFWQSMQQPKKTTTTTRNISTAMTSAPTPATFQLVFPVLPDALCAAGAGRHRGKLLDRARHWASLPLWLSSSSAAHLKISRPKSAFVHVCTVPWLTSCPCPCPCPPPLSGSHIAIMSATS